MAGVLPTLEKFGKHCVLLAGPETLHFIQRSLDTDGMQVVVSCPWVRPDPAARALHGNSDVELQHMRGAVCVQRATAVELSAAVARVAASSVQMGCLSPEISTSWPCFLQGAMFERYDCSSRHKCLIGIDLDVSQLLRVLRAAQHSGETLELKLHQLGDSAADGATAFKPFLSVSCRGQTLNMQQDIPIASPLRPSGVRDMVNLCC